MPGMDGLALLARDHASVRPRTPTLLITGHGDHELAVQALRGGAYDFVLKPIDRDYFVASLARAIEMRRLDRETERAAAGARAARARPRARRRRGLPARRRRHRPALEPGRRRRITGLPAEDVLGRRA